MSKVTGQKRLKIAFIREGRHRLKKAVAKLIANFFDEVMTAMPVEDGHAHEAWLQAAENLIGDLGKPVSQVMSKHRDKGSGDPIVVTKGQSGYENTKRGVTVTVSNLLPFVYKMEHGLTIRAGVDGNEGFKINPVNRPPDKGPLYGPRLPGNGGILVWTENGVLHRARTRTPSGSDTGFFAKAIQSTKQLITRAGGKVTKG